MPLVIEYRAVIFDRLLLCVTLYWEAPVAAVSLDLMPFAEMIAGIRSRFFTLDLAQHTDGRWRIIELGDAKVAGLSPRADVDAFYHPGYGMGRSDGEHHRFRCSDRR